MEYSNEVSGAVKKQTHKNIYKDFWKDHSGFITQGLWCKKISPENLH